MDLNQINILSLAYLGDSVFELEIRNYLIKKGIRKVNNLQTQSLNFVTAKNQAKIIKYLLDNDFLLDEEKDIVMRGRNAKVFSHPKNVDIVTYKWATSLECLFGYNYFLSKNNRIEELINIIVGVKL